MEKPDYAIAYIPSDDPQRRRHTSYFKWMGGGKPPKDFGEILSLRLIDWDKVGQFVKFRKPTKEDIDWATKILEDRGEDK